MLFGVAGAVEPPAGVDEDGAHFGVQLAELVLEFLVADHDPAAAGIVAARRRLLREVDALEDELVTDPAVEVEPLAHGPGGGEQAIHLVEIETGLGGAFSGIRILHFGTLSRRCTAVPSPAILRQNPRRAQCS